MDFLKEKKKEKKKDLPSASPAVHLQIIHIYLKRAKAGVKLIPVYTLINECIG